MRTRRTPRGKSVRQRRLTALLVCSVAVLAASAPGLYAGTGDLAESQQLVDLARLDIQAISLAHSLADERDNMALFIGDGRSASGSASAVLGVSGVSKAQRARVDSQVRELTDQARGLSASDSAGSSGVAVAVADATARLRELPGIRRAALTGDGDARSTVTAYSRVIDALGGIGAAFARALPSRAASAHATALPALSRAVDQASVQRALLAAALAGGVGRSGLASGVRTASVQEKAALADFHAAASPSDAAQYDETVTGSDVADAQRVLARLTSSSSLSPLSSLSSADRRPDPASGVWSALSQRIDLMRGVESSLVAAEATRIASVRDDDVTALELRIALAAGCLLLTVSTLGRTVRAISRATAAGASSPTQQREPADESGEANSGDTASGLVARTAVGGVDRAYAVLTQRTLGLVERQLAHLEHLEGVVHDSDELSRLFILDHLATRMRRNSESLLALAGSQRPGKHPAECPGKHPAGGGRLGPVPMVDIARAAVSETERYEQVRIHSLPAVQVAGCAAHDLSHLVAELLDNAVRFSPAGSEVQLSGRLLDGGELVFCVEDEGPGIPAERLAGLDALLADPCPTVPDDPEATGLGMYVVASIAARHRIRVRLQDHDGGGVTAVTAVPADLVTPAGPDDDVPGAPPALAPSALSPAEAPEGNQLTSKGLPQRVPRATGPHGDPAERLPGGGPLDAEELRGKLGGLQQGLHQGCGNAEPTAAREAGHADAEAAGEAAGQAAGNTPGQAAGHAAGQEMALAGAPLRRVDHHGARGQGDGASRGENVEVEEARE